MGPDLQEYKGVKVGDQVHVEDWRWPGSVDVRTVERIYKATCQGGVMVEVSPQLYNGSTLISFSWLREDDL
jgi:hypothetical protein